MSIIDLPPKELSLERARQAIGLFSDRSLLRVELLAMLIEAIRLYCDDLEPYCPTLYTDACQLAAKLRDYRHRNDPKYQAMLAKLQYEMAHNLTGYKLRPIDELE